MSISPDVRKPDGNDLVNLLPLHLQTIYKLRPNSTFLEGQLNLPEQDFKSIERESLTSRTPHSESSTSSQYVAELMPARKRCPVFAFAPSDDSNQSSLNSALTPHKDRRRKNMILGDTYRPPRSFLYDWTIPVNIEDIRSYVHSDLITEQNLQTIIFIQRQVRLLRRSMAILRLLESAHQRALVIPRIIFRLWRIYSLVLRTYRRVLHYKVFVAWRIEMLFRVKHKQMEYMCNIFLQSKYFAHFKERARINTQLNLFVVTFMKRINLRVTNDIFQFFLYLMKYLKVYRKQLRSFLEHNEQAASNCQELQLSPENPRSVYKELIKDMPIKFYDIAKALIPAKSSYLIRSFISDVQYRMQATLYARRYLFRYTLVSPIFVSWLTTIRMLRIRKNFLLLTYDKLLITAFYRWSDLARGRHKLMAKYIYLWKQYLDKLRMQRYKILLANQFRVKSLAQTYLRRWQDYCLSKDIVRLVMAASLVNTSSYARFFIRTIYLLLDKTCTYDYVNTRIVKTVHIINSYEEAGQTGYNIAIDRDGFIILPNDAALKNLKEQQIQKEEEERQKKNAQLRSLFDASISSQKVVKATAAFLTQNSGTESDSDGDSIKHLVAPPPRKNNERASSFMPYFTSYHEEFCIKFRIIQAFKKKQMARKAFLRFILLLQAADRMYRQIVSIRIWKQQVLMAKRHKLANKPNQIGSLSSRKHIEPQDIFLTGTIDQEKQPTEQSDIQDGKNATAIIPSVNKSFEESDSFIRRTFFRTHNLILVTALYKMAHSPTIGPALSLFGFIPELNLSIFKSTISRILALTTRELISLCHLTNQKTLGTLPAKTKTMYLLSAVIILRTEFKYSTFSYYESAEALPQFPISSWERRIKNLHSLLGNCAIDTVYSLLTSFNKLQTIARIEAKLLEKYRTIDLDISTLITQQDPPEMLLSNMLQEDLAVFNLFSEKHALIKNILTTTPLSGNNNSLVEQLKNERKYIIRDNTKMTSELAQELLLFDTHASNSLLVHRLLDAVSTELSAGIAAKLQEKVNGEEIGPHQTQGNRQRITKINQDLDNEAKALKSALCECFLSSNIFAPALLDALSPIEDVHPLSSDPSLTDKYCSMCQGCLCLYCSCEQRCVCMKNSIIRRALIFKNYPDLTYSLYKQIDASLLFLSDIDEDYVIPPDEYASNFQTSMNCFQLFPGNVYLRHQIDKDYLRFLLMNNLTDNSTLGSATNFTISTDLVSTNTLENQKVSFERGLEEPAVTVIVAHARRTDKNKKGRKRRRRVSPSIISPKRAPQQTSVPEPVLDSGTKQSEYIEDALIGKTADLLVNYANRELIERLEAYEQVKHQATPSTDMETQVRHTIKISNENVLRNAILYTEVVFSTHISTTTAPLQHIYLPLEDLVEHSRSDYKEMIHSIQSAQEKLLSLELSECLLTTTEKFSQPIQSQPTTFIPLPVQTEVASSNYLEFHEKGGSLDNSISTGSHQHYIENRVTTIEQQADQSCSRFTTVRNVAQARYQVNISENTSSFSDSVPLLVPPPLNNHSSLAHIASEGVRPQKPFTKRLHEQHSTKIITQESTPKEAPYFEVTSEPRKSVSSRESSRFEMCQNVIHIRSEDHSIEPIENSSDKSLLDIFQELAPDKESSSRSVLLSRQMKSREAVRQISMEINEELQRLDSSRISRLESRRISSSGSCSKYQRELQSTRGRSAPKGTLDASTRLEQLENVFNSASNRAQSANVGLSYSPYLHISEDSNSNTTLLEAQPSRSVSAHSVTHLLTIPQKFQEHGVIFHPDSATRCKATNSMSSTYIGIISERPASSTNILASNEQYPTESDTSTAVTAKRLQVSASDHILDIIQNIQSKLVDVETDSAKQRVVHLFKHLQQQTPRDLNENNPYTSKNIQNVEDREEYNIGAISDDEWETLATEKPDLKLFQLNTNISETLSRQLKLRDSGRVASPRIGKKNVSRVIQEKLLNELKWSMPTSMINKSMSKMNSGLIDMSTDSMNVTQISTRTPAELTRLANKTPKTLSLINKKGRRDHLPLIHYAKDVEDFNLSNDELPLQDDNDSFVISLDSTSDSSLSAEDLILTESSASRNQTIDAELLDMTELPQQSMKITHKIYRGAKAFDQQFVNNDKTGKVETRCNRKSPSSANIQKRIGLGHTLKELNVLFYNRTLEEYKQMKGLTIEEDVASSTDIQATNRILQKKKFPSASHNLNNFSEERKQRPIRVASSPIMKYNRQEGVKRPKRYQALHVHLAAAKREVHVHLPALYNNFEMSIMSLGGRVFNSPMKPSQKPLLAKHTVTNPHRPTHDLITSPIFLSSESSSTLPTQAPIKSEYISAWRRARKLKYDGSGILLANDGLQTGAQSLFKGLFGLKPSQTPLTIMKDYALSKIQANLLAVPHDEASIETQPSIQEVSQPSTIAVGELPSELSSEQANQRHAACIQQRNMEFIKMLEDCLYSDPITSRYSELAKVISVSTSSLYDLTTEPDQKDEAQEDFIVIKEFAKGSPANFIQDYSDIKADKQPQRTNNELMTITSEINSYYSPMTKSLQNEAATLTPINKETRYSNTEFTLTPLSAWEAANATGGRDYVVSYPPIKMSDEEFHDIVLSQTFEVLSKSIQLAHGNQMITAQRCRESADAKKMSTWEIATGSIRSQNPRILYSKQAQMIFSRTIRHALQRQTFTVKPDPVIRGFGFHYNNQSSDVLHGGPDLLASLLKWRHKNEDRVVKKNDTTHSEAYVIQSHKLTKGEVDMFKNSLWISPGRKQITLDVSDFKLMGVPTYHSSSLMTTSLRKTTLTSPSNNRQGYKMSIGMLARACAAEKRAFISQPLVQSPHIITTNIKPIPRETLARMKIGCTYLVSEEPKKCFPARKYSLTKVWKINSKPIVLSDERILNMKTEIHVVDMNGHPLYEKSNLPPKPRHDTSNDGPKGSRHEIGVKLPTDETPRRSTLRPIAQPLRSKSRPTQLLSVQGLASTSSVMENNEHSRGSSAAYLKQQRISQNVPETLSQIPTNSTETSISLLETEYDDTSESLALSHKHGST